MSSAVVTDQKPASSGYSLKRSVQWTGHSPRSCLNSSCGGPSSHSSRSADEHVLEIAANRRHRDLRDRCRRTPKGCYWLSWPVWASPLGPDRSGPKARGSGGGMPAARARPANASMLPRWAWSVSRLCSPGIHGAAARSRRPLAGRPRTARSPTGRRCHLRTLRIERRAGRRARAAAGRLAARHPGR